MPDITITKLDQPRRIGDWHDKPLKWAVNGPGDEVQQFSTKADAAKYRRIRKSTADFADAARRFARS